MRGAGEQPRNLRLASEAAHAHTPRPYVSAKHGRDVAMASDSISSSDWPSRAASAARTATQPSAMERVRLSTMAILSGGTPSDVEAMSAALNVPLTLEDMWMLTTSYP